MHNLENTNEFTANIKLLYVEDKDDRCPLSFKLLQDFFPEMEITHTLTDALNRFKKESYNLVITDLNLKHSEGLVLSAELRKIDKNIPILLLSANSDVEYFLESIHLGIDAFLLKPIEPLRFKKAMLKIIEKMDLQDQIADNLSFLQQYQDITDESAIVSKVNLQGFITHANKKLVEVSGYSMDELLGMSQNTLRHPENDSSLFEEIWNTIYRQKKSWKGVVRNLSKHGRVYYVDMLVRPILNAEDEILEFIIISHDITAVMSPKRQLVDYIESSKKPFYLSIKIEYYSDIQKYYSQAIAQQIEEHLYPQLVEFMPQSCSFDSFMLGNGEYGFIKESQESLESQLFVSQIQVFQRKINDLVISFDDIAYDISILVSLAYGDNVYENVRFGMEYLLTHKKNFIVANDMARNVHKEAQKNFETLKQIRHAIASDNIHSYFQPIVNAQGEIEKYESLVRLVDINENIISPVFFLDVAKRAKYYSQITSIVIKKSFQALLRSDKCISVNLSAIDIERYQLREDIYELLQKHNEHTHRLVFELLEDENFKDFDTLRSFISKVKSYGVQIAIDDFGSGYSNFSRILEYQPDIIKIDGSLVKNIESSSFSRSIINAILLFAKENDIKVVAEFVENEGIFEILKGMGIDYFQGYYFGKPQILS